MLIYSNVDIIGLMASKYRIKYAFSYSYMINTYKSNMYKTFCLPLTLLG